MIKSPGCCLQKLPVVLALDREELWERMVRPITASLISLTSAHPNLVVMVPKDENEFQHMIKTAAECPAPVAFRYPREEGLALEEKRLCG